MDADGNDLGGVRIPEVVVPLATGTGWNLRDPVIGAPEQLASFVGSYLPFPWTADARRKAGDPRLAIGERYAGAEDYRQRFLLAAEQAVKDRWMLAEDIPSAMSGERREWQAVSELAGMNPQ